MAKQRAARRAAREEAAREARVRRAHERARRERSAARRQRVRDLVPDAPRRRGRAPGLLAQRHRRRLWTMAAVWVLMQLIAFVAVPSWAGRAVVAALTLFALPVLWTLVYDRR